MSDLFRLVYASKNLLQGSDADIAVAIAQILDASRRNNERVGVTGALMFNGGAFAQVLEGPKRGVEDTFERIQRDPRHGDVTVLQCGPVETQSFVNWSMAFVGTSARGQALWSGLAAESGFELARLNGDSVFAMLHGLVLEEEGVLRSPDGMTSAETVAAPPATKRLGSAPDVERVRTELPQPSQVFQAAHGGKLKANPDELIRQTTQTRETGHDERIRAILAVLRAALASERQRTTELRDELDDVSIELAFVEERLNALRQERDIWAKRAQLLATALGREAGEIAGSSDPARIADTGAGWQSRSSASMKAVA